MEMKSYTNVVNLFKLVEGGLFDSLNGAVEAFKDDPSVKVLLNTEYHRIDLLFKEDVTVQDCESIYLNVNGLRPVGVHLMTNRKDIFSKYEENYTKVARLHDKMAKQSVKFNRAKRKLEKALAKIK